MKPENYQQEMNTPETNTPPILAPDDELLKVDLKAEERSLEPLKETERQQQLQRLTSICKNEVLTHNLRSADIGVNQLRNAIATLMVASKAMAIDVSIMVPHAYWIKGRLALSHGFYDLMFARNAKEFKTINYKRKLDKDDNLISIRAWTEHKETGEEYMSAPINDEVIKGYGWDKNKMWLFNKEHMATIRTRTWLIRSMLPISFYERAELEDIAMRN